MDGRTRLALLGVLALAAILFFARLGSRSLWSMELRWAEIPREMRLQGRWFWPTINGRVYYDKPLGSYWLVLAASWITGTLDEATARLPSALSALLAVLLLMSLTRRLYDDRTAVLAGLILSTSFSFVFFARCASSDMENVAGELLALWLYLRNEKRPDGWWVVGLWLTMAVTSLMKGLLGFALPLLVIGVYSLRTDGWRQRWLLNRKSLAGIGLALAVYFTPFAISSSAFGTHPGLAMVYRENIQRFFNPASHRGPVYLYVGVIFALLAPWSLLLPAALVQAWRRPGDRFAAVYFWATFIFFTLSASRRSYYLLPVLPAGAILIARLLTTPQAELSTAAHRLLRVGQGVLLVVVGLAAVALLPPAWLFPDPWSTLPPAPWPLVLGMCLLTCMVTVAYAWAPFNLKGVTRSMGVVAALSMTYLYLVALPAAETYRDDRGFAERVKQVVGDEMDELVFYRTREPVFYLNMPAPLAEYNDSKALADAHRTGQVRWVIGRRRDLAGFELGATVIDSEVSYPWEEASQRNNKMLLVLLD